VGAGRCRAMRENSLSSELRKHSNFFPLHGLGCPFIRGCAVYSPQ
jgi:hypothetical protein